MTRIAATVVIALFGLMLSGAPALAHKVIAGAYPAGDVIEGEVGFSNGDMAADVPVRVFDEAGALMGEARTDADGFFVYTPTRKVTHVFKADLGAGHEVTFRLDVAEVPEVAGEAASGPGRGARLRHGAPAGGPSGPGRRGGAQRGPAAQAGDHGLQGKERPANDPRRHRLYPRAVRAGVLPAGAAPRARRRRRAGGGDAKNDSRAPGSEHAGIAIALACRGNQRADPGPGPAQPHPGRRGRLRAGHGHGRCKACGCCFCRWRWPAWPC